MLGWLMARRWWTWLAACAGMVLAILTAGKLGEWRGLQKARQGQLRRENGKLREMQDANARVDRSRRGLVDRVRRHDW